MFFSSFGARSGQLLSWIDLACNLDSDWPMMADAGQSCRIIQTKRDI